MTVDQQPKRRSAWSDSTFERMTDRNVDRDGYRQLHDDLAAKGIDLSPEQAGNWAAAGFPAAEARECIEAGFGPNESGSAQAYTAAGLYSPQEAFMERLIDETEQLVYEADSVIERQAERDEEFHEQYEVDEETGLARPRPRPEYEEPEEWWTPPPPPATESQAEADYADSWGDIEAERAQAQGEMREYVDEGVEDAEGHANGRAPGELDPADPWTPDDPAETARFNDWLRGQAAEGGSLPGDVPGDDAWNAASADATADFLDRSQEVIDDAESTAAGWTAEDQAAFEAQVDAGGDGTDNPLYVAPGGPDGNDDIWSDDVPTPWPPLDRGPTDEELANGSAVLNEDGSTSWSPTNADFDWTSEQEERAAGHPAAQASDYEAPGAQDAWDAEQRDYNEDARSHMGGHPDSDERSAAAVRAELERAQDEHDPHGLRWMAPEDRASWEHEHYGDDADDYPGRLSPEAEEIAQGVEEREAAMDAMEADEDMVGSDAWQARQYEEQWDDRGDAEETARVEEDAAERASYEAEQREEVEAEQAEEQAEQAKVEQQHVDQPEPEDTGGEDYSGPFDEGSGDGYADEEPF